MLESLFSKVGGLAVLRKLRNFYKHLRGLFLMFKHIYEVKGEMFRIKKYVISDCLMNSRIFFITYR